MRVSFIPKWIIAAAIGWSSMQMAAADAADGWRWINDSDPAATYSPNFGISYDSACHDGDLHFAAAVGEWCSLTFTGTGVKWVGAKNSNHGEAAIYLDGKLDTTVSTASPTWLKQQELYTRTGLSNAPHTLKIQLKTDGYQDVDAFEIQGGAVTSKNAETLPLPAPVPYLNEKHRYPVGSGVGMMVGQPDGELTMLYGPGYTSSNLVGSEILSMEIDGVERPLQMEMHRAERTGVYYGTQSVGDLTVRLIDYTCWGAPWVVRLVTINNGSPKVAHDVRLRAAIAPVTGIGMQVRFVQDDRQVRCGLFVQAGANVGDNPPNRAEKSVVIAFADPKSTASRRDGTFILETSVVSVAPQSSGNLSLCHYFRQDNRADSEYVTAIRHLDTVAELGKSIAQWQGWFDQVAPSFALKRIGDARAHDLVEGALAILKTNQSKDGGIIAHSTFYKDGYIRDAALGLRGFMATGHFEEAKQWLKWVDQHLSVVGHLNDSWPCGSPLPPPGGQDPYATWEEEPAHVLLCARDYYAGTNDLDTLNALHKTLQFCMDVQLKDAISNGERMGFNGDETEVCWAVNADGSGYHGDHSQWSLSSIAMCASSLDFYIQYLKLRHDDPAKYVCATTNTTIDLNAELTKLVQAMDRDFWRTDVPEIPAGFHDFYRKKADNSWPQRRIVNFTLMPVYFGTPYDAQEKKKDVDAIAHYFDEKTGSLQLVPGWDTGFDGHDLGYLLWDLIEIGDPRKEEVYKALVNGPTVDCWGTFNEAYDKNGHPNDHDLRSLETGVNVSAIAKYWGLGGAGH